MKEQKRSSHLEELTHKHWYDISGDDPDVVHWNIVDESGKKIGEVKDLLFDNEAQKARYLITNLRDGMLEKDIRVLVPVGRGRIDEKSKRIILPATSLSQLSRLPEYKDPEHLSSKDEQLIRDVFSGKESEPRTYDHETFYDHEDFNEDRYLLKS